MSPEINRISPVIRKTLLDKLIKLAGGGAAIEAYGKTTMADIDCEIEHASAIIHTLRFANFFREGVNAKSYISFTNIR